MAKIKVKAGEKLDDVNVKAVIKAMGAEAPCSRKEACQMLNITYNSTRLTRIIEEYEAKVAYRRKQRTAMRKVPITTSDKKAIVQGYVGGESLKEITDTSFRSLAVVKKILEEFNLPTHTESRVLIEAEQTSEEYEKGDLVFSAKYSEYCEVIGKAADSEEHGAVYKLYVLGTHCMYAYQPYYELIDLRKAQDELDIVIQSEQGIKARKLPKGV